MLGNYTLKKLARVDWFVTLTPIFKKEEFPFLWDQLLNLSPEFSINSYSNPKHNEVDQISTTITKPEIGEPFTLTDSASMWGTTAVKKIINDNFFITKNSVYYILDDNYHRMVNREEKLNKIMVTENLKEVSKIYDIMIEEIYNEIKDLDTKDQCPISEALCKFTEEAGEWTREINKTFGRKVTKESKEEIQANIKEEAADTLQNFLLLCGRFNLTIEEILDEVRRKNEKWESQIPDRQKVLLGLDENQKISKNGDIFK